MPRIGVLALGSVLLAGMVAGCRTPHAATPADATDVRQILGQPGEGWLPGSAVDRIVVIRT